MAGGRCMVGEWLMCGEPLTEVGTGCDEDAMCVVCGVVRVDMVIHI